MKYPITYIFIRSLHQPESLLVLHGSVISPFNEVGRNYEGSKTSQNKNKPVFQQGSFSNTNTFERKRSTPNNTLKHIQEFGSEKPTITVDSSATLERPPKVFVHRSVELLQEKGVVESITGRNRQSRQDERVKSTPSLAALTTERNAAEHKHEVKIAHKRYF